MPEALLANCKFYINKHGDKQSLLEDDLQRYERQAKLMASQGLRVVLITCL
jgi:magnesium-transporting ATPase (P-type)